MALQFIEGFDLFTDLGGYLDQRWLAGSGGGPQGGRYGGQAWAINGFIQKQFTPGNYIVGFAYQASQPDQDFFDILTTTSGGAIVPAVSLSFGGTSPRGLVEVLLGESPIGYYYPNSIWQYFEFKCINGQVEMRVDGRVVASFSGPNLVSGFNWTSSFYTGNNAAIDDIYVCDLTPTSPAINPDIFTDYLGDISVRGFTPTSVGSVNQWAPATGANNPANKVAMVAGIPTSHNETGYYNSSLTIGSEDLYKVTPQTRGAPKAIQFNVTHCKDSSDLRSAATVARVNGSNFVGLPSPCYTFYRTMTVLMPVNPSTNAVWSLATISAAEFGVEIAA